MSAQKRDSKEEIGACDDDEQLRAKLSELNLEREEKPTTSDNNEIKTSTLPQRKEKETEMGDITKVTTNTDESDDIPVCK